MVLHEVAVEVPVVPGDQRFDLSCHRSRHMYVVVRIWAVNLCNQTPVAFCGNLGVREEFPDRSGNRSGRVWRTSTPPTMTRSHSSRRSSVHITSWIPSSLRASMRSMTENGNKTFVSMNTLATKVSISMEGLLWRLCPRFAAVPPPCAHDEPGTRARLPALSCGGGSRAGVRTVCLRARGAWPRKDGTVRVVLRPRLA